MTRFKPGDRVFADMYQFGGQGAFAEYVCAPERAFASMPDGMSFEDAATLPHSAILAVQGLRRRNGATIGPGDRVLIDGASGNVGPFAVQIAKSRGAEVTGVCSTEKVEFVRSLGADHVIDYKKVDYTTTGERYDWIVDTDSHHSILRVRRALRPKGVYVTLGGTSRPIFAALIIGPVDLAGDEPVDGPPALVEAVQPRRRRDAQGAHRGRPRQAGHRSSLPAEPDRGRAALGRRRPRAGQGHRHRGRGAARSLSRGPSAGLRASRRPGS